MEIEKETINTSLNKYTAIFNVYLELVIPGLANNWSLFAIVLNLKIKPMTI